MKNDMKTFWFIDSILLRIRFDKIDGFIKFYDKVRYLVSLGSEKHDSIYHRVRYLITVNSGITYTFFHNYGTIKVDLYNSLPLEKAITFCNVIILVNSVRNKSKYNYYCNIF